MVYQYFIGVILLGCIMHSSISLGSPSGSEYKFEIIEESATEKNNMPHIKESHELDRSFHVRNFKHLTKTGTFHGGGGGDPREIQVLPFPNKKLLVDAIKIVKTRLQKTFFPKIFIDEFLRELNYLEQKNYFFYVPHIVSFGYLRHPQDYQKIYSIGAFTLFRRGFPIYFTKQVENYSPVELARVVAQEIPHHTLLTDKRNERFINEIGKAIVSGKVSRRNFDQLMSMYENEELTRVFGDHRSFSKTISHMRKRKYKISAQNFKPIVMSVVKKHMKRSVLAFTRLTDETYSAHMSTKTWSSNDDSNMRRIQWRDLLRELRSSLLNSNSLYGFKVNPLYKETFSNSVSYADVSEKITLTILKRISKKYKIKF